MGETMISEEMAHEVRVQMGRNGGTTTKERHGHDYFVQIGLKAGRANRAKKSRLAIYDWYFRNHPDILIECVTEYNAREDKVS
jgi:hypothetical protein